MSAEAVRVARAKVASRNPMTSATNSGTAFSGNPERGTFELEFLGAKVMLSWPELELAEHSAVVPEHILALLLYYIGLCDGTRPTGRMISFAELPDGRLYVQAFRGYTGAALVRTFRDTPQLLGDALEAIGGRPVEGVGDRAWRILALPLVPVTLVWWDADDEFDARAEIMFDASVSHCLTTDGCAVLGSWLTSVLRR